jgi:hypothetical protein
MFSVTRRICKCLQARDSVVLVHSARRKTVDGVGNQAAPWFSHCRSINSGFFGMSDFLCSVSFKVRLPSTGKADAHSDLRDGELLHQKFDIAQHRFDGGAHVTIIEGEGGGNLINRARTGCRKRRH